MSASAAVIDRASLRQRGQADWLPNGAKLALGLAGLAAGITMAHLPAHWAILALAATAAAILTLIDPLVGLWAALILGPTKPLTDYLVPQLPLDLGQIALIMTLGAWLLRAVRARQLVIPASGLTAPLLIFIGAASLSLLNALSLGYALKELIKWGQIILVMWLVVSECEGQAGLTGSAEKALSVKHRRVRAVVGALLAAAIVQALIGVWQFGLRGDGPEHFLILDGRFYRAYGTFEQPNPYGGFLGLVAPVAIGLGLGVLERWSARVWISAREQRPLNVRRVARAILRQDTAHLAGLALLSGLLLAALLMSWSRGAWLGVGAAGLAILFSWPRRARNGVLLVATSLALGVALLRFDLLPASIASRLTGFAEFVQTFDVRGLDISPDNYAVLERLAHWQAAQEMARFNLWLGVGLGNYEPVYPAYALINWPQPLGHAHNIYLNLLAETGIIGLAAYAALWGAVFWQTWQVTRRSTGWQRALAIGLIGAWTHLAVHQFVDKLYVANIHLHLGALLGALSVLSAEGDLRRLD